MNHFIYITSMARLWGSNGFGPEESIDPISNLPFCHGKRVSANFPESEFWYRSTDDNFSIEGAGKLFPTKEKCRL